MDPFRILEREKGVVVAVRNDDRIRWVRTTNESDTAQQHRHQKHIVSPCFAYPIYSILHYNAQTEFKWIHTCLNEILYINASHLCVHRNDSTKDK